MAETATRRKRERGIAGPGRVALHRPGVRLAARPHSSAGAYDPHMADHTWILQSNPKLYVRERARR